MKNKKIIWSLSVVIVLAVLAVLAALRSNEDAWLCQNGEWVKHGQPNSNKPVTGCGDLTNISEEAGTVNIANPASTNCLNLGGKLEIRTGADNGQIGICKFENGRECDEWELFYDKCPN